MMNRISMWAFLVCLLAGVTLPQGLPAQDSPTQNWGHKRHHYKLVDLGTLGGPISYGSPNGPGSRLLNDASVVASSADTAAEHPDAPDFCGVPGCPVVHAFR
jgi:hypothetical protein